MLAAAAPAVATAVVPGPDLTVTSTRPLRGSIVGGTVARAAVAVKNLVSADSAAPESVAAVYLSADGVVDAGDRLIASRPRGRSSPGGPSA